MRMRLAMFAPKTRLDIGVHKPAGQINPSVYAMTAKVTHKVLALALLCGCVLQSLADQWDATRFEYDPGTGRLMR